jgi:hypothetical protein
MVRARPGVGVGVRPVRVEAIGDGISSVFHTFPGDVLTNKPNGVMDRDEKHRGKKTLTWCSSKLPIRSRTAPRWGLAGMRRDGGASGQDNTCVCGDAVEDQGRS